MSDDHFDFTPVPLQRSRRAGWSADAQRAFILALADGAGISAAARSVGRSRQTAYALRRMPDAESFAAAWDAALAAARQARSRSRPKPTRDPITTGRLMLAQLVRLERKAARAKLTTRTTPRNRTGAANIRDVPLRTRKRGDYRMPSLVSLLLRSDGLS